MDKEVTEVTKAHQVQVAWLGLRVPWVSEDLLDYPVTEVNLDPLVDPEAGVRLALRVPLAPRAKEEQAVNRASRDNQVSQDRQVMRVFLVKMAHRDQSDILETKVHQELEVRLVNLVHLECRVSVDPLERVAREEKEETGANRDIRVVWVLQDLTVQRAHPANQD